ncbi:Phenylalanine ammonia-lyase [Teratosphaeria destructans]|uniref:Phenylalanine ammonia-lyase n=1 Tax=Teratosphaeria destructans TaxID=418781 RepID=A0A9W7SU78_9PEZI|nr:Phenylalanine ammonia-lyase [Teratosphaeria destructans]
MQKALIQHQNTGVLLATDTDPPHHHPAASSSETLAALRSHALSRPTVRAAMLARCNSLLRGHSAVRLCVIAAILTLLNADYIPIIPPARLHLRLRRPATPLLHRAALEGSPDIYLDCAASPARRILPASTALRHLGLEPLVMGPKEGLGLVNGTAVSCAAAVLALHETQQLLLASQALTALCTEALGGHTANYHPFISAARPHPGQRQVAEHLTASLSGSRLAVASASPTTTGLAQDRYALRTARSGSGRAVEVELNSTTDNPLVDYEGEQIHHGGNFQAAALTSAMEKTRLVLQMLGRLLFAQTSELINPMTNNELPPNLCFDDPSVSFTCKGLDINMAAYMSELAWLAHPVGAHVQTAEMGNQSVNSLALISARYTAEAVEVLSLMVSVGLWVGCQGVDLRVVGREGMGVIEREAAAVWREVFGTEADEAVWAGVVECVRREMRAQKGRDTEDRARVVAEATLVPVTKALVEGSVRVQGISELGVWTERLARVIASAIRSTRARIAEEQVKPGDLSANTTVGYLSRGSAGVYRFVRGELGVPVHRGLVEHATYEGCERDGVRIGGEEKRTIGGRIGMVYEALRDGRMRGVFEESLS